MTPLISLPTGTKLFNATLKGRVRLASQALRDRALLSEGLRVAVLLMRFGFLRLPAAFGRTVFKAVGFDGMATGHLLKEDLGNGTMDLFNDLGPIYGKVGQTLLGRLDSQTQRYLGAFGLTKLYDDWPALKLAEVEGILDREMPDWRLEFQLTDRPLGVASLAQVHGATDRTGKRWVIKILRPQAVLRLQQTVAAMKQLIQVMKPLAVTSRNARSIAEFESLCGSLQQELSMTAERETIERVTKKLAGRRKNPIVIPAVHPTYGSDRILIVERFDGINLADVASGQVTLRAAQRAKLAKGILQEHLVQVFELGLFHADPHAGNLIMLEDGRVGLFDWGLAGELTERDRHHIAALLKAIIASDRDRLIDALHDLGEDAGRKLSRAVIGKELQGLIKLFEKSKGATGPKGRGELKKKSVQPKSAKASESEKPSLQVLLGACLKAADRLGLPLPEGLLLMVKSLITIEGLAKGIDPNIAVARVAAPVLLKAAQPKLADLLLLPSTLPRLFKGLSSC